jgi:MerR family transcriptional regulator, light-induced transcriptional regulator
MLRIGELSKRSGVSVELLRAWERRYGLLEPARSSGGYRLYSPADLDRVRRMREHLAEGLAAAEAAELASREVDAQPGDSRPASGLNTLRRDLADALERFNEPRAQSIFDRLLATMTVGTVLSEVVLPYLHELGERWQRGVASVAQEHFASAVLRGRLLGLARDWGLGVGPIAVLACAPGEQHDIGLIAFGLALRSRGWRIVYLGADTPLEMVEQVSLTLDPALVVLASVSEERIRSIAPQLKDFADRQTVAVGGSAAQDDRLAAIGVHRFTADPVVEADRLAAQSPARVGRSVGHAGS